jgi:DNA-directed RNA polymerase sigma subunit (sigma70/sigma32)
VTRVLIHPPEMGKPRPPDDVPSLSYLTALSESEKRLIESRFGLDGSRPKTLAQIGEEFGFGGERARQIQQTALRKIRRSQGSP